MLERSVVTLTRGTGWLALGAALWYPVLADAQGRGAPPADSARMAGMADHVMSGPMDSIMMRHMELTPARRPTHADSVRATEVAAELKRAIAKYQDTAVAVKDGYQLFLPNLKTLRV